MSTGDRQSPLPLFEGQGVGGGGAPVGLPPDAEAIHGLRYLPEFISTDAHDQLLSVIDQQPWLADLKRRVQHYGYKYDYRARAVDRSMHLGAVPPWAACIGAQIVEAGLMPPLPDQVIVNEYEPGQGISRHVDCEPCFGGVIASLSLGSTCVMNFTEKATGKVVPVFLQPRSLLVLSEDARYTWLHSVPARKSDEYHGQTYPRARRVSLTFRTVILR